MVDMWIPRFAAQRTNIETKAGTVEMKVEKSSKEKQQWNECNGNKMKNNNNIKKTKKN